MTDAETHLRRMLERVALLSEKDRELLNQALLLRMAREQTLDLLATLTRGAPASLAWEKTTALLRRLRARD